MLSRIISQNRILKSTKVNSFPCFGKEKKEKKNRSRGEVWVVIVTGDRSMHSIQVGLPLANNEACNGTQVTQSVSSAVGNESKC